MRQQMQNLLWNKNNEWMQQSERKMEGSGKQNISRRVEMVEATMIGFTIHL